jgi:2-succinyl-6-hydroxy-2,4-cyclohexadiene-1-carboxylate synthase
MAELVHHVDNPGGRPRIALVHGFTQTSASWGDVPARLVDGGREVVRVDLPGHGGSAAVSGDLWRSADLVAGCAGRAGYLGYSLGARVCLHVALAHPELVERLVLVGGTAGLRTADERAARRADDDARAERLERIGLDAFLDEWLSQPLFAGLDAEGRGIESRRTNTVAGLAASLRMVGTGTQEPLWERLGELAMPVLCVAGADDAKFAAVADEMAAAIGGNASVALVPGAGHTAHLEQPGAFWDAVAPWLVASSG